ncbi:MAG: hypothetical protein AAF443_00135 [Chlamydiota bacterium]
MKKRLLFVFFLPLWCKLGFIVFIPLTLYGESESTSNVTPPFCYSGEGNAHGDHGHYGHGKAWPYDWGKAHCVAIHQMVDSLNNMKKEISSLKTLVQNQSQVIQSQQEEIDRLNRTIGLD